MSITGAVVELNREIERLTKIRDSLLQGSVGVSQPAPAVSQLVAPQKRRYVRSAKTTAKSSVPAKKSTAREEVCCGEGSGSCEEEDGISCDQEENV